MQIRKLFCIFMVAAAIGWLPQESSARDGRSLDGTWEGQLKIVSTSAAPESETYKHHVTPYDANRFRITIRNREAHVFVGKDEIKSGSFQLRRHQGNAVLFAITSGNDNGEWTETWSFVLTVRDQKTLAVHFSRTVWMDVASDHDFSNFFILAAGAFERVSRTASRPRAHSTELGS